MSMIRAGPCAALRFAHAGWLEIHSWSHAATSEKVLSDEELTATVFAGPKIELRLYFSLSGLDLNQRFGVRYQPLCVYILKKTLKFVSLLHFWNDLSFPPESSPVISMTSGLGVSFA